MHLIDTNSELYALEVTDAENSLDHIKLLYAMPGILKKQLAATLLLAFAPRPHCQQKRVKYIVWPIDTSIPH
jgi:hypothetical protein